MPMPQAISPTTMAANVPAACGKRECAGRDRDDREAVEDERGRVVGEPFAFEHDQEPARQAKRARDRERRHHVGRRHDRADQEADRPGQIEHVVCGGRDRAGR